MTNEIGQATADPHTQGWNDATVIGDLNQPESQAVLSSEIALLTGAGMYTPGKKWVFTHGTVEALIEKILSRHQESENKNGLAAIYAVGPNTSKMTSNGVVTQFASKLKATIQYVTAFVGDVDGTDTIERFKARVQELGYFCVIYTTYSHSKKKTAEGDYFRFIIFLSQPFMFPADKDQRKVAFADWEARYAGMCEQLGVVDLDAASLRPNQMMFTPRHASDDDGFKAHIIAGRALSINEMPIGEASKYKKSAPSGGNRIVASEVEVSGHMLSDSFNVHEWHSDVGGQIQIESMLEALGWPVLGTAGEGFTIQCFNESEHSEPGGTGTWACEATDDESGFVIMCHHAHCSGIYTWNFIALLEQNILDGVISLPDEYESLSEMLCDPCFYADQVFGEPVDIHPTDYGVVEKVEIKFLSNAVQVKRAFKAVSENPRAGDAHVASLYAGVEMAGSKEKAVAALDTLVVDAGKHDANKRKELKKTGSAMLKAEKLAVAAAEQNEAVAAMDDESLANTSMDPAEPLGDDMKEAMSTLAHRYAIVNMQGKVKFVRKPDLKLLGQKTMQSIIEVSSKQDFLDFHANRYFLKKNPIPGGPTKDYPAKLFFDSQKRYSGITFAPPPASAGPNDFNMYYGRALVSEEGDFDDIHDFLYFVVCNGRAWVYDWLILYLAHMVQRPGDKPGTALIATGKGGVGKGTFGEIIKRLTYPHFKLIEKDAHLFGQFAGEHLSKCIAVHLTEAMTATPKLSQETKAYVTSPTLQVEPKGMNMYEVESFLRLYIEGNFKNVVMIEGNGSERRYLVFQMSDEHRDDKSYFKTLNAHINGDQMKAFLHYLENYQPEDHGYEWGDVRSAPETPERKMMQFHTMRASARGLLSLFEAGELDTGHGLIVFKDGVKVRLPISDVKEFLKYSGNKFNADDGDPVSLMQNMFGETLEVGGVEYQSAVAGQGTLKPNDGLNVRWVEFPPANVVLAAADGQFHMKEDWDASFFVDDPFYQQELTATC
ncbi:hypothetical protein NBRC116598_41510 [Pseudophaeobacter arcticus]|uniref:NrS-1 polymerase-like helicase domain-containing protein n=1 Tax=Pseudophaeobacter arcticus TaxID=385492 RepID=A0ABQ0AS60_9RHOB